MARGDGLDPSKVPGEVRAEYELFAQKCSKCHSLARPLQSGIDNDEYWKEYVERMRRQPGSGISPQDGQVILRFLRYYAAEQRKRKGGS
jgi:mono/diheme cytochrome c family protein